MRQRPVMAETAVACGSPLTMSWMADAGDASPSITRGADVNSESAASTRMTGSATVAARVKVGTGEATTCSAAGAGGWKARMTSATTPTTIKPNNTPYFARSRIRMAFGERGPVINYSAFRVVIA